ncbi:uncharacterized protein LOC122290111 [Carya illinoinensis]|uniref:uncharacterized protein LOC122290111 n=1 Tax=Carya illinoinensis TaxID=32201 RepID=UPI001C717E09|nr:uncharacterized protein LOC122290111 [Carya illinoinensis]
MWLQTEGFVERVGQWWSSYQIQGTPSFVFAGKLKALKQDLKLWNKQSFGNIRVLKKTKQWEIQELERVRELRPLNQEEQAQKLALVVEIERIILMEEISWRQKSRALWLKEGDRSTKFFHRVANSHRRSNNIEMLKIDGSECRDVQVINNHVVSFYGQLLTEQVGWRPKLEGLAFESIGPLDSNRLERSFEEAEVLEVVRKMARDKAPGPDGYSMALIPKRAGAEDIQEFCPISLVNGVYKILSKVLANCLSQIVGKIISKPQNAFVKDRQILNAVLIANETF